MDFHSTKVLFVLLACFVLTKAWSGNVCSRRRSRQVRKRVCAYRTWAACCWYKWIWKTEYYTKKYCCRGWRDKSGGTNCRDAICYPSCENGGTCTRPNVCNCQTTFDGPTCGGVRCSHLKPCYPGYCDSSSTCHCDKEFGGSGCLTIRAQSEIPDIGRSTCLFRYFHPIKQMAIYEYMTDATMLDDKDIMWTNQDKFNELTFMMETSYTPPEDMSAKPTYVDDNELGIVEGKVELVHMKLRLQSANDRFEANNVTYPCSVSLGSGDNPSTDVYNCTLYKQYVFAWDSGDWLTIKFRTKNGGFRRMRDLNTNTLRPLDYYIGKEATKTVEFRFDFDSPTHCSEDSTCQNGESPMTVDKDITREPITSTWGGWADMLSGMHRYAWEIFKLQPDEQGILYEPHDPLNGPQPLVNRPKNHSDGDFRETFTPDEAGMYSIVLEASDMANNTVYARRVVLYDPDSSITINTDDNSLIRVLTAYNVGSTWQECVMGGRPTSISVSWHNHFANKVHEDGKLLNKVRAYPFLPFDDNMRGAKSVPDKFDDHEGKRTIDEIRNVHGITEFKVAVKSENFGTVPTYGWSSVDLKESYDVSRKVEGCRPVKIWIKAHDIVGNEKVDSIIVKFDNTAPSIFNDSFEMNRNVNGSKYPFQSSLQFVANDPESGIVRIDYNITVDDTRVLRTETLLVQKTEAFQKSHPQDAYCTEGAGCYPFLHTIDIDNCWLKIPKEERADDTITISGAVVNDAGFKTTFAYEPNNCQMYRKLLFLSDPGPMHVETARITKHSAAVMWHQSPTCYVRTGILVDLKTKDGDLIKNYTLHKDTTSLDFVDLKNDQEYIVDMYTLYMYQEAISDNVSILFVTGEAEGLSGGAIAGIVIGFLLLILIIVILILLWRTGRLAACCSKDVEDGKTRPMIRPRALTFKNMKARFSKRGYDNHGYGDRTTCYEEDFYMARDQLFSEHPKWLISRENVTFDSLVASGRFANIYNAISHHGTNKQETVVAKTLKEQHSPEDTLLMKTKIQFYAEEVGSHPNILRFIGAVGDDSSIGPFMILEFCENGSLHDYLQKNRENVTTDLQDRLYRFGFDTVKGMEYLASKGIIHRRLAARNVLLTLYWSQNQRIWTKRTNPYQWMSPEFIENHRNCSEKSDVWSYGIVLWEIFSLGETPFKGIRSSDLLSRLTKGFRMEKPEQCNQEYYKLMKKCWHEKPKSVQVSKRFTGN
ncbi:hypothetical protein ScPMuIL_015765 [Solemya velum]